MPDEKKYDTGLILGLVLAAEILLLFAFAAILSNINKNALNIMPEQTAQVEAVKKYVNENGIRSEKYRVCFRFKDGVEKIFITDYESYKNIRENQKGTLYYKEIQPNTGEYDRVFIRFEKEPYG